MPVSFEPRSFRGRRFARACRAVWFQPPRHAARGPGAFRRLRGAWLWLVLSSSSLVFYASGAPVLSVTLAWDPSPSAGVSGYRVYQGTSSGNYTTMAEVGSATSISISALLEGTSYYFAITAYDAQGEESAFSNEVFFTPTAASASVMTSLQLSANPGGGMMLTLTGPPGRTQDLLASSDLQTWTVISVVSLGTDGQFNFVDPEAANYPARFYRLRETQPSVQLRRSAAGQVVLSVTGQNTRTYDVLATPDLADWKIIGAVTLDASGTSDFVDGEAANYPTRFYRTQER